MKLRLMQPPLLIDIGRIKDLAYIREEDGQIRIGAATTHYQIESSELLKKICPLLPECAGHIGDVQVRNKGTIGGSVAHSDPGGDWPAAIVALSAELVAVSRNGERAIKADDFFVELLTTALDTIASVQQLRVSMITGSGDTVLDEWIQRTSNYDKALQALYDALDTSHGVVTLDVQSKRRDEQAAFSQLPPDEFVPIAERTGLIGPMTDFVLRSALAQCRKWNEAGHHLSVAVNLSARTLIERDLPDRIEAMCQRWAVPTNRLVLALGLSTQDEAEFRTFGEPVARHRRDPRQGCRRTRSGNLLMQK